MSTLATEPASPKAHSAFTRIVFAGLAGGAVDFVYASAMGVANGRTVAKVWQGVAAGWMGRAAQDGGLATAALGVVTHFSIAIAMAGAYAATAARFPVLYRRWPLFAAAYGVLLYAMMYRVVLPLRWPGSGGWQGSSSVLDVLAHMGLALVAALVLAQGSRRP